MATDTPLTPADIESLRRGTKPYAEIGNWEAINLLKLFALLDELADSTRCETKETTLVGVHPNTWAAVQRISNLMGVKA